MNLAFKEILIFCVIIVAWASQLITYRIGFKHGKQHHEKQQEKAKKSVTKTLDGNQ
jgi:hypothetical protein